MKNLLFAAIALALTPAAVMAQTCGVPQICPGVVVDSNSTETYVYVFGDVGHNTTTLSPGTTIYLTQSGSGKIYQKVKTTTPDGSSTRTLGFFATGTLDFVNPNVDDFKFYWQWDDAGDQLPGDLGCSDPKYTYAWGDDSLTVFYKDTTPPPPKVVNDDYGRWLYTEEYELGGSITLSLGRPTTVAAALAAARASAKPEPYTGGAFSSVSKSEDFGPGPDFCPFGFYQYYEDTISTTATVRFNIKCPGKYRVTFNFEKIGQGHTTPFSISQEYTFNDINNAVVTKQVPFNDNGSDQPDYDHSFRIVDATAESSCPASSGGDNFDYVESIHSGYCLGHVPGGGVAWIRLDRDWMDANVYNPAALAVPLLNSIETIRLGRMPRQVKAPEVLADINVTGDSSYEMSFYYASQVGSKDADTGLYVLSGSPYVTYRFENPTPDTPNPARLRITKIQASSSSQTEYAYDNDTGSWSLSRGGSTERRSESMDENSNRVVLLETMDAAGNLVSSKQQTYQQFSWGEELVKEVVDPSGAALTTTYEYEGPPPSGGYGGPSGGYGPPPPTGPGHLSRTINADGSWERYEYDTDGVTVIKTVRPFLNAPPDAPEQQCRVSTVSHGTMPDADGDGVPEQLDTAIEYTLGQETARRYTIHWSKPVMLGSSNIQRTSEIACAAAGGTPDASGNLVTTRLTYTDGALQGTDRFVVNPDGTANAQEVVLDGSGNKTITTKTGQPSSDLTDIVAGTKTTSAYGANGQVLAETQTDIETGLTLSSWIAAQLDDLGRPTRLNYTDGTFVLRSYACCGLESETDRLGVTTSYTYLNGRVHTSKRFGITTRFEYDAAGRQTDVYQVGTDGTQRWLSHDEYDLAGRLVLAQEFGVRTTTYSESIDSTGQTTRTKTFPDGGTKIGVFARDASPLSVSGTAAAPLTYEYTVEGGELVTKITKVGSNGETTEWVKTYTDFLGRGYKTVYADGAVETKYFNGGGQLVKQVDADGIITLFAYNARGEQEVAATDMNENGMIDYAGIDRITKTINSVEVRPDGGTSYTVNRATTLVWPDDTQDTPTTLSIVEQSTDGLRTWRTVAGLTTSTVVAVLADGTKTVTSTSPEGVVTVQTYSGDQLQSATVMHPTIGTLSSETYQYDALGRLQASNNVRTGTTTYSYWPTNDLQSVTTPDPDPSKSGPGYDPQTTSYTYDAAGRIASVTQPDGGIVYSTYWPTGATKRVWGARTYPTEYSYDSQGRIKTLTTWKDLAGNAGTAVTTWNYDGARGFLSGKRYADNFGPDSTYTPAGRLLTRRSASGIVATYNYNAAGDVAGISYSNGDPAVAATFDRLGRRVTRSDAAGVCQYTYIGLTASVATESYSAGLLAGIGVARRYDAQLRPAEVSATSGGAASIVDAVYSYDAASRLQTVTFGGNAASYEYIPNSALVGVLTFRNGGAVRLATTTAYDRLNRTSSISSTPSASAAVSHVYTYNSANQRVQVAQDDGGYWAFSFDPLGQVVAGKRYGGDGQALPGHDFAWTYDDIGNRVSETINTQTAAYTSNGVNQYASRTVPAALDVLGAANADATVTVTLPGGLPQMTTRAGELFYKQVPVNNTSSAQPLSITVTGVKNGVGAHGEDAMSQIVRNPFVAQNPEMFTYDSDGNLTDDARWHYSWNAENRLITMETAVSAAATGAPRQKIEFVYDALGRRVSKKLSTSDGTNWSPVKATLFVYDGNRLLAELDAMQTNAVIRTYVWGNDLSGSFGDAGGVTGLLSYTTKSGGQFQTQYFSYDDNGNVTALISAASGAISARYQYSPFGKTLYADESAATDNPIRFSTKYVDSESGLLYYGSRYYNPDVGRWISRDRGEEENGANLFGFVSNDPVKFVDVLGRNQVDGHYYHMLSGLYLMGVPLEMAKKLAFYSELPDELTETTAFDEANMFSTISRIGRQAPDLRDAGDWLHSLGLKPEDIQPRRNCLMAMLADPNLDVMTKGFVLHALADAFSHTYETFQFYPGPRNDPTNFRFGPSITTGYPEYIGHGLNGTWPDIIRNRPHRYVDFLRSVQTAMFPYQDIRALNPLTSHILNPDDPVHVQASSTYPNARQLTQTLTGDALSEYRPELIDPHSLTINKGEPYSLPDGLTIKNIISLMKCRCAK